MSMRERIVALMWDRRWLWVTACVLITLAAGWQAAKVGVDNSLEIWFVGNDPNLVAYRKFQHSFGNDEVEIIAFHDAGGMVNRPGVELLERAAERIRRIDGVAGALSIADVDDARRLASFDDGPQAGTLRERVLADPLVQNRLASRDGTTVLLVIRMAAMDSMDARRDAILSRIDAALAEFRVPYHKAGIGVIYAALNQLSIVDACVLFCASWLLIALVLWRLLRRWAPVAAALAIVGMATVWTLGLYGACGRNLNIVTAVMPTLILVIGIAECVHILMHVAAAPDAPDRRTKVVREIAFMLRPCLINTLTTVAGLASLAVSPLPVVRDLGLFSALGLIGCCVLTLVGCTWALAWERTEPDREGGALLQRPVAFLSELGMRCPGAALAMGLVLVALMGVGASRIKIDTYTIDFLFAVHPVRQASELIESRIGPYLPLEFVVRSPHGALHPQLLRAIERWQRAGESQPGVGWSVSIVDMLARAQGVAPSVTSGTSILDDPARVARLLAAWRALPGNDLHLLLDEAGALRVTFSVRMQSARSVERAMAALMEAARLPDGVTVAPAGYLPLYVRMADYVVSSQIQSFALAFVMIFVMIGVAFRSARTALLAIPANLLPVLIILGVMGYAGIRLDVATVTIASIVLGLVVDDTVHVLHQLHHEFQRQRDHAAAVRATLDTTGRAILITTSVLVAGFSVFALAEIKSVIWFGLLIALGLLSGVIADLVLMPALVVWLRPRLGTAATTPAASAPRESRAPVSEVRHAE
jgi:predicted RND superfamily exporter protein